LNSVKGVLLKYINPHSFFYLLNHLVKLITGIICIRWVIPDDIGLWQLFLVVESYLMFLRFGVLNAFNREFSFLLGRGDKTKAFRYLDTVEAFTLIICALVLPFIFVFHLFNTIEHSYYYFCLFIFAAYLPSKLYSGFMELVYITGQDFKQLSKIKVIMSFAYIFTIALVYYMDFKGFLIRILVLALLSLLVYCYYRPYRFNLQWNFGDFKKLFVTGIPFFISNYTLGIVVTVPTLFLAYFGTIREVGLYYPVGLVISFGALLPSIISIYLLPKLNFDFGKNNNGLTVINDGIKSSLLVFLVMIPLSIIGWFLVPFFMELVLPEYIESTYVVQLGVIFSLTSPFLLMYNPFTVLKAWNHLYVFLGVLVVLNFTAPYLMMIINENLSLLENVVIGLICAKVIATIANYIILTNLKKTVVKYEVV